MFILKGSMSHNEGVPFLYNRPGRICAIFVNFHLLQSKYWIRHTAICRHSSEWKSYLNPHFYCLTLNLGVRSILIWTYKYMFFISPIISICFASVCKFNKNFQPAHMYINRIFFINLMSVKLSGLKQYCEID